MASKKLKTFALTSEKPYDRHTYKLVLNSGKAIVCPEYDMARAMWFQYNAHCKVIEVLDK